MNVLEELWYGNLEPSEFDSSPGKEYKELLHLVSRNEEKLLATMTTEQKELFSRYSDLSPQGTKMMPSIFRASNVSMHSFSVFSSSMESSKIIV